MTGSPSRTWAGLPFWLIKTLGVVAGIVVFFAGIVWLNHFAREQIRTRERYLLAFDEIDCARPPGLSRNEFLDEVQYLSGMTGPFSLLEEGLAERLGAAFAMHPWVARVEAVELAKAGKAKVRLVFRVPVLLVVPDKMTDAGGGGPRATTASSRAISRLAAVDASGILVPRSAETQDLPILHGPIEPPAGPSGKPWGDERVHAAARTAAFLHTYRTRLHLDQFSMTKDELVLETDPTTGLGRVLWGHAPGQERAGEPSAALKVQRLLEYCTKHGGVGKDHGAAASARPIEHDVRHDAARSAKP